MLPKVATQLIHHTTRAVAAVQGSGNAFRNILQSSSSGTTSTANWSGVGASGSSWGSAGTGAGGAKYQSSSKFYHGYQVGFLSFISFSRTNRVSLVLQGAGRSLTQASQASVDSGLNQTDDTEDPLFRPGPIKPVTRPLKTLRRPRSHSLVLGSQGQVENTKTGNSPGVLEVVQVHARASHAFAPHHSAVDEIVADPTLESRPKLSRRASTSSVTSSPPSNDVPSPSLHPQPVLSLDPSAPQSVTLPIEDPTAKIRATLTQYLNEKDSSACTYVNQLLEDGQLPQDATVYEAAIQAVAVTYKSETDVSLLTKLFDEMVRRNLPPSAQTYQTLILAHLNRDSEVATAISYHKQIIATRKAQDKVIPKYRDRDFKTILRLRSEPNLRNAIRTFQAANKAPVGISPNVYADLLCGCARHLDEYAALRVFACLEKEHGSLIPSRAYYYMMELYMKMGNLAAVEEVFSGFKKAAQLGKICYESDPASLDHLYTPVAPWNLMIDAYFHAGRQTEALTILETMLDPSDPSIPRPSLSTFQTVITGFCRSNDVETALKWFQRLLQETTVAEDASIPLFAPPRPDATLWEVIISALTKRKMVDETNSLYFLWLSMGVKDNVTVTGTARKHVIWTNLAHLEALQWRRSAASSEVQKKVDYVMEKIVGDPRDWILAMDKDASVTMERIVKLYGRNGRFDEASEFLQTYVRAHQAVVGTPQAGAELSLTQSRLLHALGKHVLGATEWFLLSRVPPSFAAAKEFVSVANGLDKGLSSEAAESYLSIYEVSKRSGQIVHLTVSDVETLIAAGVRIIYTNNEPVDGQPESHPLVRFETLLTDITSHLHDLSQLSPTAIDGVLRGLQTWYPTESLQAVLEKLGGPWSALWNHPFVQERVSLITSTLVPEVANDAPADGISEPSTPSSGTAITTYRVSNPLSQRIDDNLNNFKTASPIKAYNAFIEAYADGFYPTIATLGKLINALGRSGETEKVNLVYETAQHAIATANTTSSKDPNGPWYQIEDQMIIALAHAGDVESAHNHRRRILEYGGTPSADAYGALISCVKDTTDDSANAYTLYRESQIRGVVPNVYLYNTIISKLAKARKADLAMELFSKMKANGFWPSSVSYGAVIGACSRVGDVESAEALFEEMSSQPNFRPRVPPFNTMMQLYTYTKRNREKVLYYYNSMVSAGVRPTAHTYKVGLAPYLCDPEYANLGS